MTTGTFDTREHIVESAVRCFSTLGLTKTTMVHIGRAAGVSRSTVYEYFENKAAILEACAEHQSQRFYRELASAMAGGATLEEKFGLAAAFVTQQRGELQAKNYFDEEEVSLLLTKDAAQLLRECSEFLAPYLTSAKLTGEVRRDLDVYAAGEWFARMLFSLFSTPSSTMNMNDPGAVGDFVRTHIVRGFGEQRTRKSK